jgi:hypothetical protein
MISALAAMALQATLASNEASLIYCLADLSETWITPTRLRILPDGRQEVLRRGEWVAETEVSGPEAEGTDWYRSGAEILHDGQVYRPSGEPFMDQPTGRYYAEGGRQQGVPYLIHWPLEGRPLAVLVKARGCVFRLYAPLAAGDH